MTQKRLALYLDGTWNQVSDNTNIWRFRALFLPASADGCEQLAYYSTGLGTKFGEKISGGLFGAGIDTAITSAYEWLIDNYMPNDEIFIFGFSRGAYTARSLVRLHFKMRTAAKRRAARRQPAVHALPARGPKNHPRFDRSASAGADRDFSFEESGC